MLFILACVAITAWLCRDEIRITRDLLRKTKKLFCRACDEEITYNPDNEPLGRGAVSCRTCYAAIEADLQKMLPEWYTKSCPPVTAETAKVEKTLAEIGQRLHSHPKLDKHWTACQQCGAPPSEDCKCSYRDATVAKCARCWANRFDVSPQTMYCWSCYNGNPSGPGTTTEVFHLHTGREITVVKHKCTKCKVNLIESEIESGRCMKCSAESWSDQILDVYSPPQSQPNSPDGLVSLVEEESDTWARRMLSLGW